MRSQRLGLGLLSVLAILLAGCRFHLAQVEVNRPLRSELYESIALGAEDRHDVLVRLGPPDEVLYTPADLIFDYLAVSHRGTDFRVFLPTEALPFFNPTFLLSFQRFFFDPSSEPEAFRPTFMEGVGRSTTDAVLRAVPFAGGEDMLILRGHQLRADRLRVVFDRRTLVAVRKALRLATGAYAEESLARRVLLRSQRPPQ